MYACEGHTYALAIFRILQNCCHFCDSTSLYAQRCAFLAPSTIPPYFYSSPGDINDYSTPLDYSAVLIASILRTVAFNFLYLELLFAGHLLVSSTVRYEVQPSFLSDFFSCEYLALSLCNLLNVSRRRTYTGPLCIKRRQKRSFCAPLLILLTELITAASRAVMHPGPILDCTLTAAILRHVLFVAVLCYPSRCLDEPQ